MLDQSRPIVGWAGWRVAISAVSAAALGVAMLATMPGSASAVTVPTDGGVPATADGHAVHDGKIVSQESVDWTPQVRNGSVRAITAVGDQMIVAGDFSTVRSSGGATDVTRRGLFAFNKSTGRISDTFAPVADGRVNAVLPGPSADTVWVAGAFKTINGEVGRVFLLDTRTGLRVSSVPAVKVDGPVQDLAEWGSHLLIGGYFTTLNTGAVWETAAGLGSVDLSSAVPDGFLDVVLEEHHSWYEGSTGIAKSSVGTHAFDVNQHGTLAVVGNFRKADGLDRDQVALIDLNSDSATVIGDWKTNRYTPACSRGSFDSYMRGVQWNPAGDSMAITTTGASYPGTLCDSVTTWDHAARGQEVEPVWADFTGGDTLFGVSATDVGVYVGGHQRWMNNTDGRDNAQPGSVARPGIAVADSRSGVPFNWNPGRHPRGVAVYSLYSTPEGLWMGSDTEYLGRFETFRPRLAFFPVSSGTDNPAGATRELPSYLMHQSATEDLTRSYFDGTALDPAETLTGQRLSSTAGATLVDNVLFTAGTDGTIHRRTFDGTELGPDTSLDPYQDPLWKDLATGSGSSKYVGVDPELAGMFKTSVRGIEYRAGRLYYTQSGSGSLWYTGFSPESGIIEPFSGTSNTRRLSGTLDNPGEFVMTDSSVYYVRTTTGDLMVAPIVDGAVEASTVVSGPSVGDSRNWTGSTLFLAAGPKNIPNEKPTAAIDASCDLLTCTLSGTASSDPDGEIVSYDWEFGDGETAVGPDQQHTYAVGGPVDVTLTVTDNRGGTDTKQATVSPSSAHVEFVTAVGVNDKIRNYDLTVPAGVEAGDLLLVTTARNVGAANPLSMDGAIPFTQVADKTNGLLRVGAFSRVATAGDAGKKVTFTSAAAERTDIRMVVYRGVDPQDPIERAALEVSPNGPSIVTPTVQANAGGSWLFSGWFSRSATVSSVTPPAGVTVRSLANGGTSQLRVAAALGDSNEPVGQGPNGGLTAALDVATSYGIGLSLLLRPAA